MRARSRLTITLPPELVDRIDGTIDGTAVRNRSHAIELLVRRGLEPEVSTAVLLAGGETEEDALPALAPIGGEPLVAHTLHHLAKAGIRCFVLLAGSRLEDLEAALRGLDLDVELHFVQESEPRGTAGALRAAEPFLGADPFLVLHGDVFTDIDVEGFARFHRRESSLATMAVKPRRAERYYGKVLLEGNRITEFLGRDTTEGFAIINTGVYLFEPTVLSLIGDEPSQLETDVFPSLARMGELSAFFFQGIWYDIRRPENYRLAQARWREKGGASHAQTARQHPDAP